MEQEQEQRFYTYCRTSGNYLYYRGVENGRYVRKKVKYKPYIFIPTTDQDAEYKAYVSDEPLEKVTFPDIRQARDFLQDYEASRQAYYGNTSWEYVYLEEQFPDGVKPDPKLLRIANIDIEVASDNGFPKVELAEQEITAICLKYKEQYYVFGCGEYTPHRDYITYIKCDDEVQLLKRFIKVWEKICPDIVLGYNNSTFDVPYLFNRLKNVLGEAFARRLSPFRKFSTRQVNVMNKTVELIDVYGVSVMDFLELYKKYAPNRSQESYKLNHIASVELGEKKLAYDGTLQNLYLTDHDKFIRYNIKDVQLVDELEKKLKLVSLAVTMAYDAKVNFQDVFSQVRMWDTLIYSHLMQQKIVIPPKTDQEKSKKLRGAYVKEPQTGLHKWVVSFDLNSLYPSIIGALNISPDTITQRYTNVTLDDLTVDSGEKFKKVLAKEEICLAGNGHTFKKDKQGVLPYLLDYLLTSRRTFKNQAIEDEKQLQRVRAEIAKRGKNV